MVDEQYDVVVLGGGAAGLSGAVALARSRRRVLVVDAGDPRNAPAEGVHNLLGNEGVAPADLLAAGRAELLGYGGEVLSGSVTTTRALRGDVPSFAVTLAGGREVQARRLLVTTGLRDELPDVPGLAERWGRDVLHCPFCHGWEARDRAVGVLATGPAWVHQALMWRQLTADLTVLLHSGPEPDEEQAEQLAALGIAVVRGEVAEVLVRDDALTGARLADGRVVELDGLVVAPRFVARDEALAGLGLTAEEVRMGEAVMGWAVPTTTDGATSVPGVRVAGNVGDLRAQVVVSAAQGLSAGAMLHAELVTEDTAQAVARGRAERSAVAVG